LLNGVVLNAKSSANNTRVRLIQSQDYKVAISYITPSFDFFSDTDYLLIVSYSANENKMRVWFNSRKGKDIPINFSQGDLDINSIATFGGNQREFKNF
jgi:hypothetical protein